MSIHKTVMLHRNDPGVLSSEINMALAVGIPAQSRCNGPR